MKMARIILFTGQIEAMNRFYGEVLGLRQVTDEKGWKEFAAGGVRIALHSGPPRPAAKVRRSSFTRRMLLPCGQHWYRAARASARSARGSSASATARTRTVIPFSCPTVRLSPAPLGELG
jgi:catechol 2,3-dioxygenase-like lactoylglutathione lyase family enzyme